MTSTSAPQSQLLEEGDDLVARFLVENLTMSSFLQLSMGLRLSSKCMPSVSSDPFLIPGINVDAKDRSLNKLDTTSCRRLCVSPGRRETGRSRSSRGGSMKIASLIPTVHTISSEHCVSDNIYISVFFSLFPQSMKGAVPCLAFFSIGVFRTGPFNAVNFECPYVDSGMLAPLVQTDIFYYLLIRWASASSDFSASSTAALCGDRWCSPRSRVLNYPFWEGHPRAVCRPRGDIGADIRAVRPW